MLKWHTRFTATKLFSMLLFMLRKISAKKKNSWRNRVNTKCCSDKSKVAHLSSNMQRAPCQGKETPSLTSCSTAQSWIYCACIICKGHRSLLATIMHSNIQTRPICRWRTQLHPQDGGPAGNFGVGAKGKPYHCFRPDFCVPATLVYHLPYDTLRATL